MAADARPGVILQHSRTGPPGRLGDWLTRRGIAYEVLVTATEAVPADPAAYAFVATLGSSRSVNDAEPAWIGDELAFLRRAVAADVPVLGLCWGAQALAVALGGTVGPSRPEKGWIVVDSEDPAIPVGPWVHYHSEIFSLPAGAVQVASSPAGPAAFRHGRHLAVQFHPEADSACAMRWAGDDPNQTAATIDALRTDGERYDASARELADAFFDGWYAGSVAR